MLRYPRNLRGTEIQLLITVLLFFAAGYLLIVAASGAQEVRLNVRTVADILGHRSPDFTLRQYAYSFEEVRQRAVADMGKLLWDEERVLELPPIKERQELE
jgi:hypothetical protein